MALETILREKRAYLTLEVDRFVSGSTRQERSAERKQRLKSKSSIVRAKREMYRKHKRDRQNTRNAQDDCPGKLLKLYSTKLGAGCDAIHASVARPSGQSPSWCERIQGRSTPLSAAILEWTPGLRHGVKGVIAVRWKSIGGEVVVAPL